jgi:hypothetical protein
MEAIAIVHSSKPRLEVYQSLKKLFAEGSFDEASLGELITTLGEAVKTSKYPPDTVDRIVKLFIHTRGPGYEPPAILVCQLVDLLVRNFSKEHANEWLDMAKEMDEAISGTKPRPSPHAAFLNAISKVDPQDTKTQVDILTRMQVKGIVPDTSVYNTLISSQIQKGNLNNAFTLYSALLQLRPDSSLPSIQFTILPDATTFHLMFRVLKMIKLPRGIRSRQFKRPKNAISAIRIYADMVESHLIQTRNRPRLRSPAVDASSLHMALRVFIIMHDYAAAYIVVRSLGMYGIPPNIDTYRIVIKGLLQRMHHELGTARATGERRWADVMLGNEESGEQAQGMTADMVVQLVQFGLDRRITLDVLPDIETLEGADDMISLMPSMSMIMGQENPKGLAIYPDLPLKRILRRAVLAQSALSTKGDIARLAPATLLSKIIWRTKDIMLRKVPSWVKRAAPDKRTYRSRHFSR